MWRKLVVSVVVGSVFAASIVHADVILTVNGSDLSDSFIMTDYPGQIVVAIDGNTAVGSNDVFLEVLNGTLDANEPNGGYYFQFAGEGEAQVNLITQVEMIIDGRTVPADTVIYQLWMFYNAELDIYAVCGEALLPPEEGGEGGQDESAEETFVQQGTNTESSPLIGETTDSSRGTTGYDPYWDLNADNRIDFADFAIFGAEWGTTYNIFDLAALCAAFASADCCADMNVPDITAWQDVYFTTSHFITS